MSLALAELPGSGRNGYKSEALMTLQRTHILLEPEQQRRLAEIAHLEGRSRSDLARELIRQGLEQRQVEYTQEQTRRLAALDNARQVRREIHQASGGASYQVDLVDLIQKMRQERDNELIQRGG
jgi:predicted DNA-binding protein